MSDTPAREPFDELLQQRMREYYDQRAPDYDQAYTLGTGTSSIARPEVFISEAVTLAGIVRGHATGRLLDLACGTAFWFPHYAANCSAVTLIDQSAGRLEQARRRVATVPGAPPCTFLHGNVFEHEFGRESHDIALVGFLISHLTLAQEAQCFHLLRQVLGTAGRFLILESAWTSARARYNRKIERQTRRLADGTAFEIFKRYIDRDDVARWSREHRADLQVDFCGDAFLAVSGRFHPQGAARR